MARLPRPRPKRLPAKLKSIRVALGLSQNEMLGVLGMKTSYDRSVISGYERGEKEPPLPILLKYARTIRVSTDVLIDDELDLPSKFLS